MPLTDETRTLAREIIARYPKPRSALLPMLHLVQSEEGYVTPAGIGFCAEELGLTKAEVGAVATFYTMYKRRPTGEYLVSVCTNTLCGLLGGDDVFAALRDELGVGNNETTPDGSITLEHAECLAACDFAPVVTVNYEYYDQQSPDSAVRLTRELRAGRAPHPTRGAPLCSFKQISRQLAGFPDERPEALDGVSVGEPTLVGVKLALRRGETAPAYEAGDPAPSTVDGKAAEASGVAHSMGTPATGGQTSAHDAPLDTAKSDPDHPANAEAAAPDAAPDSAPDPAPGPAPDAPKPAPTRSTARRSRAPRKEG